MGIYLKIGDTDVSRFITENRFSVISEPVYDEESAFTNIYGERVRMRTGHSVRISAVLTDVDDLTAAAISEALSGRSVDVSYSAPQEKNGSFESSKFALSLDRVYRGEKFWTADIQLFAGFIADDGL